MEKIHTEKERLLEKHFPDSEERKQVLLEKISRLEEYLLEENGKYVLKPEAAKLFRENVVYYLFRKGGKRREDIAEELVMDYTTLKGILSGQRRLNSLEFRLADLIAEAIQKDISIDQFLAPLPLYLDPRIKEFLHVKINREYTLAMMKYIKTSDKDDFVEKIKELGRRQSGSYKVKDDVFHENLRCYLREKEITMEYIAKKLKRHPKTLFRNIKKEEWRKRMANALELHIDHFLTPQLFDLDPEIKWFVNDERNVEYMADLVDYRGGVINFGDLQRKIMGIKKKNNVLRKLNPG